MRTGSYFPARLLERRRRAEQALISVVATAYLLGVSTRRVEKLAQSLGSPRSKSQVSAPGRLRRPPWGGQIEGVSAWMTLERIYLRVSAMAKHLDEQVAAFRSRPLDTGP